VEQRCRCHRRDHQASDRWLHLLSKAVRQMRVSGVASHAAPSPLGRSSRAEVRHLLGELQAHDAELALRLGCCWAAAMPLLCRCVAVPLHCCACFACYACYACMLPPRLTPPSQIRRCGLAATVACYSQRPWTRASAAGLVLSCAFTHQGG
jgi:hypothetical protein